MTSFLGIDLEERVDIIKSEQDVGLKRKFPKKESNTLQMSGQSLSRDV